MILPEVLSYSSRPKCQKLINDALLSGNSKAYQAVKQLSEYENSAMTEAQKATLADIKQYLARLLFERSTDICSNCRNNFVRADSRADVYFTYVSLMICHGDFRIPEGLLSYGARHFPDRVYTHWYEILSYCVHKNDHDNVDALLKAIKFRSLRTNLLLHAIENEFSDETLIILAEHSLDLHLTNDKGENPIMLAIKYGKEHLIKHFYNTDGDLESMLKAKAKDGLNALAVAVLTNNIKAYNFIEANCRIDKSFECTNRDGKPLIIMAHENNSNLKSHPAANPDFARHILESYHTSDNKKIYQPLVSDLYTLWELVNTVWFSMKGTIPISFLLEMLREVPATKLFDYGIAQNFTVGIARACIGFSPKEVLDTFCPKDLLEVSLWYTTANYAVPTLLIKTLSQSFFTGNMLLQSSKREQTLSILAEDAETVCQCIENTIIDTPENISHVIAPLITLNLEEPKYYNLLHGTVDQPGILALIEQHWGKVKAHVSIDQYMDLTSLFLEVEAPIPFNILSSISQLFPPSKADNLNKHNRILLNCILRKNFTYARSYLNHLPDKDAISICSHFHESSTHPSLLYAAIANDAPIDFIYHLLILTNHINSSDEAHKNAMKKLLFLACARNNLDAVTMLLPYSNIRQSINQRYADNNTALHHAMKHKNYVMVKLLLASASQLNEQADLYLGNDSGETAVSLAGDDPYLKRIIHSLEACWNDKPYSASLLPENHLEMRQHIHKVINILEAQVYNSKDRRHNDISIRRCIKLTYETLNTATDNLHIEIILQRLASQTMMDGTSVLSRQTISSLHYLGYLKHLKGSKASVKGALSRVKKENHTERVARLDTATYNRYCTFSIPPDPRPKPSAPGPDPKPKPSAPEYADCSLDLSAEPKPKHSASEYAEGKGAEYVKSGR